MEDAASLQTKMVHSCRKKCIYRREKKEASKLEGLLLLFVPYNDEIHLQTCVEGDPNEVAARCSSPWLRLSCLIHLSRLWEHQ